MGSEAYPDLSMTNVMGKTHLHLVAIATAINVEHCIAWLNGEDLERTRVSAFARPLKCILILAGKKIFPKVIPQRDFQQAGIVCEPDAALLPEDHHHPFVHPLFPMLMA